MATVNYLSKIMKLYKKNEIEWFNKLIKNTIHRIYGFLNVKQNAIRFRPKTVIVTNKNDRFI